MNVLKRLYKVLLFLIIGCIPIFLALLATPIIWVFTGKNELVSAVCESINRKINK